MLNKIKEIFKRKCFNKLDKIDYLILIVLLGSYGIFSFINLGSITNPETFAYHKAGNLELMFRLPEDKTISKIRLFTGPSDGVYQIMGSVDNHEYYLLGETDKDNYVLGWYDVSLTPRLSKYIKLVAINHTASLGELKLYDSLNKEVKVRAINNNSKLVLDEQDCVPEEISYMNSTYFDEVYFARTAYEYTKGIATLEWVHPPLGKLIQSIPIRILGMNPFSYRLMGNCAGILLILVMYLFARTMFKNKGYATIAALLMMFDNFHFAQTRMGTVDSFLVLFILTSFYFMYKYIDLDIFSQFRHKISYLGLSGLFIGCAIATKWTGLFAGLGLAIIFFTHLIYNKIKKRISNKDIIKIILSCCLFFVVVPITIYIASYFLFPNVSIYHVNNLNQLGEITSGMYKYHSTLEATHSFSSEWYTWPLMLKPVWYYSNNELTRTISGLGNPIIWWSGLFSLLMTIYYALVHKNKEALIILLSCACLFLPYIVIGRCMFLYHYFPVLPFIMLSLVLAIKIIADKSNKHYLIPLFMLLVIAFFVYFYPVTSGIKVDKSIISSRRWLSDWYF